MNAGARAPRAETPIESLSRDARGWSVAEVDEAGAQRLADALGCTRALSRLLVARGYTDLSEAEPFLRPSLRALHPPQEIPDIDTAANTLATAVRSREKICIYGDYDVDGLSATALLVRVLQSLGAEVETYVPNRLTEGYGVNVAAVERIAADGVRLIVTVDGGSNDHVALGRARELGVQVIVTDHHPVYRVDPELLLVHPGRPDHPTRSQSLAGVGVAYKLVWALGQALSGDSRVGEGYRELMVSLLSLVALGTVADVVPLLDENRALVHYGLRELAIDPGVGVRELMRVCQLDPDAVNAEDVAFRLAPHLNAAGRMGAAEEALELLLCDDQERARELAQRLATANRRRKEIEKSMVEACEEQIESGAFDLTGGRPLVLADRGWHSGVAGIVASRLVDRYRRPTFVIAIDDEGLGRGSARTVENLPLDNLYDAGREIARSIGGHAMAGGVSVEEADIERFRSAVVEAGADFPEGDRALRVDARLTVEELTPRFYDEVDRLAPFGQKNPVPRFLIEPVTLAGQPRLVGKDESHLVFSVKGSRRARRAICFGGASWAPRLVQAKRPFAVVAELSRNVFNGETRHELRIVDIGL